jgi:serine phosphatase RsbU (regulator of sigma subunit)
MHSDLQEAFVQLSYELENFEQIARYLTPRPRDVPRVAGIDIYGGTLPLSKSVGGDHLIYIDFKALFDLDARIRRAQDDGRLDVVDNLRRCGQMAGIALLDASGHRMTDAFLAAMLHQAFLLGAVYELDMFGRLTKRLFENLNMQFYEWSSDHKFVSMTYGEISEDASFRFLSAAQPFPIVFSRAYDRIVDTRHELCASFPPLGLIPSRHTTDFRGAPSVLGFKDDYEMNEWVLEGAGDILLLHTDGLTEQAPGRASYYPDRLEQRLREVKDEPAKGIFGAITADLLSFSEPADDISLVVIKRS